MKYVNRHGNLTEVLMLGNQSPLMSLGKLSEVGTSKGHKKPNILDVLR